MAGARHWRRYIQARGRSLAAPLLLVSLATGCKSGTWAAKPSWWSAGGTPPSSSLTAAPSFDKEVSKPSQAAKPYPTTGTPEGYSLTAATGGSTPAAAAIEPSSVTYGAAGQTAAGQTAAAPPPRATGPVTPQVGPYASLQPAAPEAADDPAMAATAGFAAPPAFGEVAPAGPAAPAARVADARGSESWAAPPSAGADARYNQGMGSRFSTSLPPGAADLGPLAAPPTRPTIDPSVPSSTATTTPPAATPFTTPTTPPAATAAPAATLPGAVPPPRRRADPGYRPGGTSSYRPNRAILADEDAAGDVMPASFEAAAGTP